MDRHQNLENPTTGYPGLVILGDLTLVRTLLSLNTDNQLGRCSVSAQYFLIWKYLDNIPEMFQLDF